ncbi:MAG: type II secretion system F family protein [Mesorhizobium sp.]
MTDYVFSSLTDGSFLVSLFVAIAVFASLLTIVPSFGGNTLQSRMKSVALEREELRNSQRSRLAEAEGRRRGLRIEESKGMRSIVDRLDLRRALADENTLAKLKVAGFRGNDPLNRFLFFRLVLPFVFFGGALFYVYGLGEFAEQAAPIRFFICVLAAYAGFYAPILYVNNRANKRKTSIQKAWPDALDLMLICVESGMSVEAGLKKVSEEIGSQSIDLAEELVLTTAELSFLQERRQAYDNLASRTGVEAVKSVTQALVQAERYGTPVAHALRVLAQESREARLTAAEKKAAALPPKLTVPMILFFLPVLFLVILGPAGMQISAQGGFSGMMGGGAH